MKRMSQDWCLESKKTLKWNKDRIEIINKRIDDLQLEKQSYERIMALVNELCLNEQQEGIDVPTTPK